MSQNQKSNAQPVEPPHQCLSSCIRLDVTVHLFPTPAVEETILSSLSSLGILIKAHLIMYGKAHSLLGFLMVSMSVFFFKILFICERQRERESETQAEEEAGMQGA